MTDQTAAHRRRVRFAPTYDDAASAGDDRTVVLDAAWTPRRDEPTGATGLRRLFAVAVEGHDLLTEALKLVDGWAKSVGLADRLVAEDVTYWYRLREDLWHWVHERLLWRYALVALESEGAIQAASAPVDETALLDVLGALGVSVEVSDDPAATVGTSRTSGTTSAGRSWRRFVPVPIRSAARRFVSRADAPATLERRRWDAFLEARLAALLTLDAPRIVVLTRPSRFQRIGADDGRRSDPNLGAVIPALVNAGFEPIKIGHGMRRDVDADQIAIEDDDRLLPAYFVQTHWGAPEDKARATAAVEGTLRGLDGLDAIPFVLDGLVMTQAFLDAIRTRLDRTVRIDLLERARVERLIRDLAPDAVLMTQEGHRTGWLAAAARAGVPSFALQHGVLYPTHPGYPDRRDPRLILPSRTFVFGDYERRVLEAGAYNRGEVIVSGSPRLDLDATSGDVETARGDIPDRSAERGAVRAELGVADGDRMLVVSTVHTPFVRRSHLAHMLEASLGGPLPGVHIVIKQHPGERDEGPYRELLHGLARAGGYAPPPMSVVRDIDLYRLLRAADAHLGLHSTVLTDAVLAGTVNLIARCRSGRRPARVRRRRGRPAGDASSRLCAWRSIIRSRRTRPPGRTFIEDHFRPGEASARIVDEISNEVGEVVATRTRRTLMWKRPTRSAIHLGLGPAAPAGPRRGRPQGPSIAGTDETPR